MSKPPVELPAGQSIPQRTNRELAEILDHEEAEGIDGVYRGR
jgi:hypothetical protein